MTDGKPPVVLVVEDEFLVQVVAVDLLEDQGFQVQAVFNAEEAIRVLGDHCGQIDVLFTDINLGPGANGFDLAKKARQLCPGIRVIYVTGAPQKDKDLEQVGDTLFLQKPYAIEQVVRAVADGMEA